MVLVNRAIRPARGVSLAVLVALLAGAPLPAAAQDNAETRIRKMEAEIRALQRKVFPGGDQRYFEPEISASSGPTPAPGAPATSAVSDILTRMDALEGQMARLTGQIEQNANRISQLESRVGAGAAVAPAGSSVPAQSSTPAPAPTPSAQANLNAMSGGASATPAPAPAPATTPSASRVQAVSAIVKPQTDDAADDEYSYGFRLWDATFYPEAQQQLKMFLEKYPNHWRASWARNLLGRSYLDQKNPSEAAKWFLQNYQADKAGGRAADSLLYLAVSMKQLKDTKRACIALAEFSETYAAEAAGRLKSTYDSTRNGLTCS